MARSAGAVLQNMGGNITKVAAVLDAKKQKDLDREESKRRYEETKASREGRYAVQDERYAQQQAEKYAPAEASLASDVAANEDVLGQSLIGLINPQAAPGPRQSLEDIGLKMRGLNETTPQKRFGELGLEEQNIINQYRKSKTVPDGAGPFPVGEESDVVSQVNAIVPRLAGETQEEYEKRTGIKL